MASDNKWYPPESAPQSGWARPDTTAATQPTQGPAFQAPAAAAATQAQPTVQPSPPAGQGWFRRNWVTLLVGAVALFIGTGIGVAAASNQDEVDKQAAEINALKSDNASLQEQVDDRSAQQAADEARAKAAAEERKTAKEKEAAEKRAAAAKVAAEKKAAADAKAAADKKAADARAKAAADAAAAAAAAEAEKNTIDSDGVREVGVDINPGRWKTQGGVGSCYYAILGSSDTSNIVDNNITDGPATVDLRAGQFFETTRCSTWTRVG